MKKTGQSQLYKAIILFGLILMSIGTVSAFGVSAPYWGDNPLMVSAGESKETGLYIQNLASGDEDLIVEVELLEGEEIVTRSSETTYDVPFGTDNLEVPLLITIPSTAKPGDSWMVTVNFKSANPNAETGTVTFNTGVQKSFEVIVKSPETTATLAPEEGNNALLITGIVLVVIILAVIIYILLTKGKDEPIEKPTKKRK